MNRVRFVAATAASAFGAMIASASALAPEALRAERPRPGDRLTLPELVERYPAPVSGDLLQYELGFGATYDKQIGFGHEATESGTLLFVESQVGNGDHACNPNTLKKVYLKTHAFAGVFTPYSAMTYITRSGNMLARWGDGVGPSADKLLLLDTKMLYDARRATVTRVSSQDLSIDGRTIATTRVAARYPAGGGGLHAVEVWLSAAVPLGIVKMTATAPDLDPFTLSVYKFARHFKTELAMSLQTVRTLTPTGDVPVFQ